MKYIFTPLQGHHKPADTIGTRAHLFGGHFAQNLKLHLFSAMLLFSMLLGAGGVYGQVTHTVCPTGCDFTTVQAAYTAAASGDIIDVSDGSYSLSSLTLNKSMTIKGNNAGIAAADGTGTPPSGRLPETELTVSGELRIAADDITIDGMYLKSGERVIRNGTEDAINFILENCLIENTSAPAFEMLHFFGSAVRENWIIRNNRFSGAQGGTGAVLLGGNGNDGILVEKNDFMGTGGAAMFGEASDLTIRSNYFASTNLPATNMNGLSNPTIEDNIVNVNGIGFQLATSDGGVIRNNTFVGVNDFDAGSFMLMRGIDIFGTTFSGPNSSGLVIENNVFQDFTAPTINPDDQYRGIHMRQGAEGILIRGNIFSNSHTALGIVATTPAVEDITLEENDLSGVVFGIRNGSSESVDAPCNWWGTTEFSDIEDLIEGGAEFVPYLSDGADNDPVAIGFQPAGGSCIGGPVKVFSDATETNLLSVHATIQAGIDAAVSGNVVRVDDGTYSENVIINKADVIVRASNEHGATVQSTTGNIFRITQPNVTLDGFVIDGTGRTNNFAGLQLSGADAIIKNNRFLGNSPNAGTNMTVSAAQGILFSGSNDNALIEGNFFTEWLTGIFNQSATGAIIRENTFENVRSSTANDGVSNFLYTRNTFIECWNGISNDAATSGTFTIEENVFIDLNNAPIVIRDMATTTINSNSFAHSAINSPAILNLRSSMAAFDATCNWFGSDLLADVQLQVSADVNFIPYLVDGMDVDPAMPGFQPVSGSCVGGPVKVFSDATETTLLSVHATIQAGIDAAVSGNVVRVDAGTYDEDININKHGLILRGSNAGIAGNGMRNAETIIDGTVGFSGSPLPVGVTVDGFTINGPAANPGSAMVIYGEGSGDNLVFENNIVNSSDQTQYALGHGTQTPGLDTKTGWIIRDNVFNGPDAVNSTALNLWRLENLLVQGNDINNVGRGIQLLRVDDVIVSSNSITNARGQGIMVAADAVKTTSVTVTGNEISNAGYDNNQGGIRLYSANLEDVTVTNNSVNNSVRGVHVAIAGPLDWINVVIENNDFSDNGTGLFSEATSGTVTATCNWWGSSDLSTVQASISGDVNFSPYLVDGTDNDPAPGFQPVPGSCVGGPVQVTGTVRWEHDLAGVPGTDVELTLNAANYDNDVTNAAGQYSVDAAPGGVYEITPTKTVPVPNCGVDVVDVTTIQEHVTFINLITDPYKLIAADVNQSGTISTLDALLIAQVLLGNPAAAGIFDTYWRFVDADYVFPNPAAPWSYPSSIVLPVVAGPESGLDFIGVAMGDVNGTGDAANDCPESRNADAEPLTWQLQDQELIPGSTVEIVVHSGQFNNLKSFQFGMRFDRSHLELLEVIPGDAIDLKASNFGLFQADQGELRCLWWDDAFSPDGVSVEAGTPVFTLRFQVQRFSNSLEEHLRLDGSVLSLLSQHVSGETSGVMLDYLPVVVTSSGSPSASAGLELFQNRPNPFTNQTYISFHLPNACDATLRVLDLSGREVWTLTDGYQAGYHEVRLRWDNPVAPGVFFYELITPDGRLVRKMVSK